MNPFDQALNGVSPDGLEGIGSKLKKAVKKVVKIHKKVLSPVAKVHRQAYRKFKRKALPDKVERAVVKIEKSPITKAVAIGAATFFAGPAVYAALGFQAPAQGALSTHLAKSAGKEVLKGKLSKKLSKKAKKKALKVQKAMLAKEQQQANAQIEAELRDIVDDPAFVGMAKKMLAEGKSVDDIVSTWKQSDAYKNAATIAATGAVYPAAYNEMIASGASPEDAAQYAQAAAANVGEQAATQVQNSGGLGKVALIAIPLLIAALGG